MHTHTQHAAARRDKTDTRARRSSARHTTTQGDAGGTAEAPHIAQDNNSSSTQQRYVLPASWAVAIRVAILLLVPAIIVLPRWRHASLNGSTPQLGV